MNELRKILIISRYSFVEIYKSKVIYNILFLGFAICGISYLATEFTFGAPQKVAIDIGLGALSLSAVGIAIFMGAGLISKETESRTAYMILVRPLRRSSFIIGKILGMLGILILNTLMLALLSLGAYVFLGGELSTLIGWSVIFSFLEAAIVLLVVVFFSLMTNTVMSVIYTLAVYISGHAVSGVSGTVFIRNNDFIQTVIKYYHFVFPNFSKLNLKDHVVYKQEVEWDILLHSVSYAIVYLITLTAICAIIFDRKNLD